MSREAMQQALDALGACSAGFECVTGNTAYVARQKAEQAIDELTSVLSEPAPEPVAWMNSSGDVVVSHLGLSDRMKAQFCIPVYAAPPAQPAPSVPEWIVCSERMPEMGVRVMVWRKHATYPRFAFYQEIGVWENSDSGEWLDQITHWMPLQAPPKEES